MRLESKIRIISPAIDMIELIAARGNTSLESAVTLTKEIRYEIQSLGVRLANAAHEEELLRRQSKRAKSREQNEIELRAIVNSVRKLLTRIEDAVPLINLAITTSGVNLSTTLPATVSPSRLLQASTFLTAADSQYASHPGQPVQVGPTHTLSLYMLFAGHAWRPQDEEDIRETTWKEVIHKARLKLMRVPLNNLYDVPGGSNLEAGEVAGAQDDQSARQIPAEGLSSEFAYQLLLIEDLNDDRVHTAEEDGTQPGPYDDVALAGIRDVIPIHEISKIFYADTGKILGIGSEGETNSPILLLKRDVSAEPPRRMMERWHTEEPAVADGAEESFTSGDETEGEADEGHEKCSDTGSVAEEHAEVDVPTAVASVQDDDSDDQAALDAQILRDSTPKLEEVPEFPSPEPHGGPSAWRLPPGLDPEWVAFEVYTEDPSSEDESDLLSSEPNGEDSRPSSSRQGSVDPSLTTALSKLKLRSPTPSSPGLTAAETEEVRGPQPASLMPATPSGPIKTSLSLLEMLIRLTALQQFRQSSHLTIEDELLNFFLEDSSTTGAGPNAEYRRQVRWEARRRVGFDPYDESPIKRRGEEYLAHPQGHGTPPPQDWQEYGASQYGDGGSGGGYYDQGPGWERRYSRSATPDYPRPSIEYPYSRRTSAGPPSSPSPRLPQPPATSSPAPQRSTPARAGSERSLATPPISTGAKGRQHFLRSKSETKTRSPLGREVNTAPDYAGQNSDSALGTSPSSEKLSENLRRKKGKKK